MRASLLNTANNAPLSSALRTTPRCPVWFTVHNMVMLPSGGCLVMPFFGQAPLVLSSENVLSDDFWECVKCLCLCLRPCLKRLLKSNFYSSARLFFCCCGRVFDMPCLRWILINFSCFVMEFLPSSRMEFWLRASTFPVASAVSIPLLELWSSLCTAAARTGTCWRYIFFGSN